MVVMRSYKKSTTCNVQAPRSRQPRTRRTLHRQLDTGLTLGIRPSTTAFMDFNSSSTFAFRASLVVPEFPDC
eukprot:scaffold363_cov331-Pavlova_lutheri.AAC.81